MNVPTHIRTNILEMAVVMAAIGWHVANDPEPGPRHAHPDDADETAREDAKAEDRLHDAVKALQAEYALMFQDEVA